MHIVITHQEIVFILYNSVSVWRIKMTSCKEQTVSCLSSRKRRVKKLRHCRLGCISFIAMLLNCQIP